MAGPLDGLKILDFTSLLPGPFATLCLADLGAQVLKIVSPSRPDMVDLLPPQLPGSGMSSASAYLNRGKRSLALNLKDNRAAHIVHRLLGRYDILIESFRPGVMARLGLDYETLKMINPAVIYCSLSGYGQTGPLRNRAGHDINYLALSGLMAYSGRKAGGPSLTGMQIADLTAGAGNTVIAVLAAVIARNQTGKGQYLDIAMTDGMTAFHALMGAVYLAGGEEPKREESYLNGGAFYDFYETGDGKYLAVGCLEPQFFQILCETIGRPDLAAGGIMLPDMAKVKEEFRAIFKTKTRDEWTAVFRDVDACVDPVLTMAEAMAGDQVRMRGLVVDVPLPGGGTIPQIASPLLFSQTHPEYVSAAPTTGQHTREVMSELGYSPEDIDQFEKTGLFQ